MTTISIITGECGNAIIFSNRLSQFFQIGPNVTSAQTSTNLANDSKDFVNQNVNALLYDVGVIQSLSFYVFVRDRMWRSNV
jgi:hypothetical protein